MALSTSSAVDMVLFSSFTLIRRPNALGVKLRLAATEAHTATSPPTARCPLQLLVGLTPTDAACDALLQRTMEFMPRSPRPVPSAIGPPDPGRRESHGQSPYPARLTPPYQAMTRYPQATPRRTTPWAGALLPTWSHAARSLVKRAAAPLPAG